MQDFVEKIINTVNLWTDGDYSQYADDYGDVFTGLMSEIGSIDEILSDPQIVADLIKSGITEAEINGYLYQAEKLHELERIYNAEIKLKIDEMEQLAEKLKLPIVLNCVGLSYFPEGDVAAPEYCDGRWCSSSDMC